ncbi:hypothetical protein BH10ACT11_BH10ACT11_16090 [soil metagenome]
MSESRSCVHCGGATEVGQFGPLDDPQLFFAKAEVKKMGPMRVVQGTGPRLAVSAARCTECGRLELFAEDR